MAFLSRIGKCVKCRHKTINFCQYCDDAICFFHSDRQENGKSICNRCIAKFYIAWNTERDEDETYEQSYKAFMRELSEKEMSIGNTTQTEGETQ